jgi:hypothetical protein
MGAEKAWPCMLAACGFQSGGCCRHVCTASCPRCLPHLSMRPPFVWPFGGTVKRAKEESSIRRRTHHEAQCNPTCTERAASGVSAAVHNQRQHGIMPRLRQDLLPHRRSPVRTGKGDKPAGLEPAANCPILGPRPEDVPRRGSGMCEAIIE